MFKYLVYKSTLYFELTDRKQKCSNCLFSKVGIRNCIQYKTFINGVLFANECNVLTFYSPVEIVDLERDLLKMKLLGLATIDFKMTF